MDKKKSRFSRLFSIISSLILMFMIGAWLTYQDTFPYRPYLETAFFALESNLDFATQSGDPLKNEFWSKARFEQKGVTTLDRSKVFEGPTFFCARDDTEAQLVDLDGDILHEWSKPFDEAWQNPSHMSDPANPEKIIWDLCHLYKNGDILAVYKAANHYPGGHGMVRLDENSHVKWKYPAPVHHDIEVQENGKILTLIRRGIPLPEALDRRGGELSPRILESSVVWLSASGEELKRISLVDAILDSEYSWIATSWRTGIKPFDPFHFNNLERVPAAFAERFSEVEKGDIFLSSRDLSAFLVLDPDREKIVWAQKGYWSSQHDPDFMADGTIVFFDNLGLLKRSTRSRVVHYNPENYEILWSYSGSDERKLFTHVMGEQQYLPNDNVLIAESKKGRLLEVTPSGDIVWEYIHQKRETYRGAKWIPSFSHGVKRYPSGRLTFLDRR